VQLRFALSSCSLPPLPSLYHTFSLVHKVPIASLEKWFDDTIHRVSGWYKRKVQLIILALGLLITFSLNVDTISLITSLSNDTVTRASIVSAAQGTANTQPTTDLAALQKSIEQVQPVIGWSTFPADFWSWVLKIIGLLATTFAVSLGAPFWFDVLNKFMLFRSSGPPPQTSTGAAGSTGTPLQLQVVAGTSASPPTITSPAVSTNGATGAAQ
jgi:hypothetical protein